ncbi:hypothetical protein HDU93_006720 [Gonapodya sp. JEL0774]|nr:hypothetical protein HDU93_006720 [Gonapodya sp. JEL0774]
MEDHGGGSSPAFTRALVKRTYKVKPPSRQPPPSLASSGTAQDENKAPSGDGGPKDRPLQAATVKSSNIASKIGGLKMTTGGMRTENDRAKGKDKIRPSVAFTPKLTGAGSSPTMDSLRMPLSVKSTGPKPISATAITRKLPSFQPTTSFLGSIHNTASDGKRNVARGKPGAPIMATKRHATRQSFVVYADTRDHGGGGEGRVSSTSGPPTKRKGSVSPLLLQPVDPKHTADPSIEELASALERSITYEDFTAGIEGGEGDLEMPISESEPSVELTGPPGWEFQEDQIDAIMDLEVAPGPVGTVGERGTSILSGFLEATRNKRLPSDAQAPKPGGTFRAGKSTSDHFTTDVWRHKKYSSEVPSSPDPLLQSPGRFGFGSGTIRSAMTSQKLTNSVQNQASQKQPMWLTRDSSPDPLVE